MRKMIAIINSNDVSYSDTDMNFANLSPDKITDVISDFFIFKEIEDSDQLMNTIITEISGEDNSLPIHTSVVSHIRDELYQMCHVTPLSEEIYTKLKFKKYNGIASYLSDINMRLYGKAVIFKINGKDNSLTSLNQDSITKIFRSKFIHQGVIINSDNTFDTCQYIFNPVDWIGVSELSNYKYHEVEILGLIFMIFHNLCDQTADANINDAANILLDDTNVKLYSKIKGRVIIAVREYYTDINDQRNVYTDIDIDTVKKVIKLCNDFSQSRKLSESEDINGQMCDGRRIHVNFHQILENRIKFK